MLNLPAVTLIAAETQTHELAKIAVEDALTKATFAEVLIYTDKPDEIKIPGARYIVIPNFETKQEFERFVYCHTNDDLHTSHLLYMEWDSGIADPLMWSDKFLEFDFIGAPWWYGDGLNVGNGGFALRSKRLMDKLAEMKGMPFTDDLLCRTYRPELEKSGLKWAPTDLAHDFAFECCRPSIASRHFGYHAMRNWPYVMSNGDLKRRFTIAASNPYVKNTIMVRDTLNAAPWLKDDGQLSPA